VALHTRSRTFMDPETGLKEANKNKELISNHN